MNYPKTLTDNLTRYDVLLLQVPPSWNQIMRKHWGEYIRVRDEWHDEFYYESMHVPKNLLHVYLEATIYYPKKRTRDADNCMVWKLTQDAMKKAGIISDDNPAIVTTLQPTMLIDRNKPRTEITIWANQ